jgi:hypothetical protein
VLEVSLLIDAVLLPWAFYRRQRRLLALAATVLMVVPMNALLCGVISCTDPRLQDRIVWMIALLAGLLLAVWLQGGELPDSACAGQSAVQPIRLPAA